MAGLKKEFKNQLLTEKIETALESLTDESLKDKLFDIG
jgi:hypothetical protein